MMGAERPQGMRKGVARLLVTDDHDLVREGIRAMLDEEPGLEVVGEAADGQEALEACRWLQPNLVLMDVRMPRMDGLAATRAIKREFPATSILMVTMHQDSDYLFEALKAGAAGYVLKESSQEEVLDAVRQVLEGESPLHPQLSAQLLRRLVSEKEERSEKAKEPPPEPEQRPEPPPEALTPREVEVLGLLVQGKTNREIAQELVVSPGTVKVHVEHIIGKLGVSDRTQAAVRAIELSLFTAPSGNGPSRIG